jgi:hypothetical protein
MPDVRPAPPPHHLNELQESTIMKRYLLATFAAIALFGSAQAREVAYCDSGFDIQKVSGDKAVCAKTEKFWDDVGSRACPPGTAYVAGKTEASDGGDLCYETVSGKQMSSLPALPCGIGQRMDINRGARDKCQAEKERTVFGNIKTRNE